MTEQERIAEIRARCEHATQGPWNVAYHERVCTPDSPCGRDMAAKGIQPDRIDEDGNWVTILRDCVQDVVSEPTGAHVYCQGHDHDESGTMDVVDAEFMAHAREDLPWALQQIADLSARLAALEAERDQLHTEIAEWERRNANQMGIIADFSHRLAALESVESLTEMRAPTGGTPQAAPVPEASR